MRNIIVVQMLIFSGAWIMRMSIIVACLTLAFSTVSAEQVNPTLQLVKQQVPVVYTFTGAVEAIHKATMTAETSGRIAEVFFDVDDIVDKGDVIARFRNNQQKADLDLALAGRKEAEAALARDESEFKRYVELYEKRLVAKALLDQARAALDGSKARLEASSARIKQARENYENTVIRAPYSGIVTKRHIEVGEAVNPGSPLVSGLSLDKLRLVVDVPQSLIESIRQQKKAQIVLNDGKIITSEALTIFPYADDLSHTFRVRVELPEDIHGVYPGMLIKVGFVTDQQRVLTIPVQAMVHRGEMNIVYVQAETGQIHMRQIRPGPSLGGGEMIVHAGLTEGETIWLDPVAATIALKQAAGE